MYYKSSTVTLVRLMVSVLVLTAFFACTKTGPAGDDLGPYNINAVLHSTDPKEHAGEGFGLVKFRQDPDTARIITLDTYLKDLAPNHDYSLQRSVNPITDPGCSDPSWLTLGLGLVPQNIHTDAHGNGHEQLFRNVTAVARGTSFWIHFQVIDAITLTTVLTGDCEQYTVR